MNVYVSPELRERMREFDAVINWSQVASTAFEVAIENHIKNTIHRMKKLRMHHSWVKDIEWPRKRARQ